MGIPQDKNALKYYRVAKQRLNEAELILSKAELPAAAIYIAGYAVECILKALLLIQTPAGKRTGMLKSLKDDFGHDLYGLYEGAQGRGANPPPGVSRELSYVSSWSPEQRYTPGPGNPKDAQRFIKSASVILDWADGKM